MDIEHTAKIVAYHVSHNQMSIDEIKALIAFVVRTHMALSTIPQAEIA